MLSLWFVSRGGDWRLVWRVVVLWCCGDTRIQDLGRPLNTCAIFTVTDYSNGNLGSCFPSTD